MSRTILTTQPVARVQWLSAAEGGRKRLPLGSTYSAVARFEHQGDTWMSEAWSLVLDLVEPPDDHLCHLAKVRFLVEGGPAGWLAAGNSFQLMEGSRVVARGTIIEN